jgi:hypothetical protein
MTVRRHDSVCVNDCATMITFYAFIHNCMRGADLLVIVCIVMIIAQSVNDNSLRKINLVIDFINVTTNNSIIINN